MWKPEACDALRQGKCLELRYDGFTRIVEVHSVGTSGDGHDLMRVWQVRGGSVSNERTGWKLFRLDETFSPHISAEKSYAPRNGYKRGDKAMQFIDCEI